jgi:hypothetical protein
MDRRSLFVLLIFALGVLPGAIGGRAQAAPLPADATAISAPKSSVMKKTGEGCGWDYPCPPVPDFGRHIRRRDGGIYIHNNYGPVNVYVRGAPPPDATDRRPAAVRPCDAGVEGGIDCGEATNCGGFPCDENCGPLCWMRRFKKGYCGHGCWAYIEQSRIAAKERAIRREEQEEAARREERRLEREAREQSLRGCDYNKRCPPVPYKEPRREEARRWDERPRYENPRYEKQDDLTPREPFVGPRYLDTCTDGAC